MSSAKKRASSFTVNTVSWLSMKGTNWRHIQTYYSQQRVFCITFSISLIQWSIIIELSTTEFTKLNFCMLPPVNAPANQQLLASFRQIGSVFEYRYCSITRRFTFLIRFCFRGNRTSARLWRFDSGSQKSENDPECQLTFPVKCNNSFKRWSLEWPMKISEFGHEIRYAQVFLLAIVPKFITPWRMASQMVHLFQWWVCSLSSLKFQSP